MDWKSLTEVTELGIVVRDCECVASDLQKIFEVYWDLGQSKELGIVIRDCPCVAQDLTNIFSTYSLLGEKGAVVPDQWDHMLPWYWVHSKVTENRQNHLDTIIGIINSATQTICVSVMEFIPVNAINDRRYWPDLDNAIRQAAYRGVAVKMLVSKWEHSPKEEKIYLESLAKIASAVKGSIKIKWLTIPATAEQQKIDHARVSRNNYMVTENSGYIGTSNWVGDYFLKSAGVGIVVSSKDSQSVQEQLQAVFDRDWNSEYASPLV